MHKLVIFLVIMVTLNGFSSAYAQSPNPVLMHLDARGVTAARVAGEAGKDLLVKTREDGYIDISLFPDWGDVLQTVSEYIVYVDLEAGHAIDGDFTPSGSIAQPFKWLSEAISVPTDGSPIYILSPGLHDADGSKITNSVTFLQRFPAETTITNLTVEVALDAEEPLELTALGVTINGLKVDNGGTSGTNTLDITLSQFAKGIGVVTNSQGVGINLEYDLTVEEGHRFDEGEYTTSSAPIYPAADVTDQNITNWVTNHTWYTNIGVNVDGRLDTIEGSTNNWDTAYGWDDHSTQGYLTDVTGEAVGALSDVVTTAPAERHALMHDGTNYVNRLLVEDDISDLGSYITDYTVTEGDVTNHQAAITITESQISDLVHYTSTDWAYDFEAADTGGLSEGTNLYHTAARAVTAIKADEDWAAIGNRLDGLEEGGTPIVDKGSETGPTWEVDLADPEATYTINNTVTGISFPVGDTNRVWEATIGFDDTGPHIDTNIWTSVTWFNSAPAAGAGTNSTARVRFKWYPGGTVYGTTYPD